MKRNKELEAILEVCEDGITRISAWKLIGFKKKTKFKNPQNLYPIGGLANGL